MQSDLGTVMAFTATAAPSGLQVNSKAIIAGITNIDKMQTDPGTIAVLTTSTAPSGSQVNSRNTQGNCCWCN
jgi:hypothetical protein